MKRVIITGATGMVGGIILQECLNSNEVNQIISISRQPIGMKHEKLVEVIHSDFTDYSGIIEYFKNIDVAYFCIGVYTGSVSRELFREITVDYTVEFAKVLKENSPNVSICFLSGSGADQTEKSRMMFAADKGAAENFLISQNFKELYIFRPAYIYPVNSRKEPNFSYRIFRVLYPIFRMLMPNGVITSEQLAKVIFKTGLQGGNQTIYENKEIKNL